MAIIDEIGRCRSWKAIINKVKRTYPRRAHYIFTQAMRPPTNDFGFPPSTKRYGDLFANYIEKNRLGTVVRSREVVNPNSSNLLTTYVWTVNPRNLGKFK